MRSKEELLRVFEECRVDLRGDLVVSCGSGVTAAIVFLALDLVGKKEVRLFDGSWVIYNLTFRLNTHRGMEARFKSTKWYLHKSYCIFDLLSLAYDMQPFFEIALKCF